MSYYDSLAARTETDLFVLLNIQRGDRTPQLNRLLRSIFLGKHVMKVKIVTKIG